MTRLIIKNNCTDLTKRFSRKIFVEATMYMYAFMCSTLAFGLKTNISCIALATRVTNSFLIPSSSSSLGSICNEMCFIKTIMPLLFWNRELGKLTSANTAIRLPAIKMTLFKNIFFLL